MTKRCNAAVGACDREGDWHGNSCPWSERGEPMAHRTWPHSAAAIERQFGGLKEETRANILGINAARFFNRKIPAHVA